MFRLSYQMNKAITTTLTNNSRIDKVNFDNLGFGSIFSDHMFQMDYVDGFWCEPEIVPYAAFMIEPGALCLHYGQSVFEGLKAYMGIDNVPRLFRPDRNAARLQNSCKRLCIPSFDTSLFFTALDSLVKLDQQWIPKERGKALYFRPLIIGLESNLTVKPSEHFRFYIMSSPVREYFNKSTPTISLKAEHNFTRAAPGGMGHAKTAGNYAASLLPGVRSISEGHDQVLWLDGVSHEYIEEVGQMNIFFYIGDKVITPELRGTILPGVTRESVIELLRHRGIACEERRISIQEIIDAAYQGTLKEAFGAGTAAIIAPVGNIDVNGQHIQINNAQPGELASSLYNEILDIQTGASEDTFKWNRVVEL